MIPGFFPGEPVGAADAILWHLQMIDYHDEQALVADAFDCDGCIPYHDGRGNHHRDRLRELETLFPETAKHAHEIMEAQYRAWGEEG